MDSGSVPEGSKNSRLYSLEGVKIVLSQCEKRSESLHFIHVPVDRLVLSAFLVLGVDLRLSL